MSSSSRLSSSSSSSDDYNQNTIVSSQNSDSKQPSRYAAYVKEQNPELEEIGTKYFKPYSVSQPFAKDLNEKNLSRDRGPTRWKHIRPSRKANLRRIVFKGETLLFGTVSTATNKNATRNRVIAACTLGYFLGLGFLFSSTLRKSVKATREVVTATNSKVADAGIRTALYTPCKGYEERLALDATVRSMLDTEQKRLQDTLDKLDKPSSNFEYALIELYQMPIQAYYQDVGPSGFCNLSHGLANCCNPSREGFGSTEVKDGINIWRNAARQMAQQYLDKMTKDGQNPKKVLSKEFYNFLTALEIKRTAITV